MTQFEEDCMHFHGKILMGIHKHYCPEYDYLPIDETCMEFEYCMCEWEDDHERKTD